MVGSGWEAELRGGLAVADGRLLIACPFIKHSVAARVLNLARLDEIVVVTRFSLSDFARGLSDVAALETLLEAGADLRGMRGLHDSVFVFGTQRAAVTSAHLSEAGLRGAGEFGCVSDEASFIAACAARVEHLHAEAAPTTPQELREWEDAVTHCLRTAGRNDAIDGLPDHGAAPQGFTGREGWVAESRQAFVKFSGQGHNRAPMSRSVIDDISRSGAFQFGTYPIGGGHPWRVEAGATIFMSRMTKSPNDMRIIGRAIALAHDPDHDMASGRDIRLRPWLRQWPYLVRVHHATFIDGTLADGVSLNDLLEELGPFALRSTRRRLRSGEQNINPRRSYTQKPDVELSAEGFRWMTQQFETALARHGSIPDEQIRRLR
jgi:hypothetical protein